MGVETITAIMEIDRYCLQKEMLSSCNTGASHFVDRESISPTQGALQVQLFAFLPCLDPCTGQEIKVGQGSCCRRHHLWLISISDAPQRPGEVHLGLVRRTPPCERNTLVIATAGVVSVKFCDFSVALASAAGGCLPSSL